VSTPTPNEAILNVKERAEAILLICDGFHKLYPEATIHQWHNLSDALRLRIVRHVVTKPNGWVPWQVTFAIEAGWSVTWRSDHKYEMKNTSS